MTTIDMTPTPIDPDTGTRRIVVACDDSPAGWSAVGWAEEDAAVQPYSRLVLCRVYRGRAAGTIMPPIPAFGTLELFDPQFTRQIRQARQRLGSEHVEVAIRVGDTVTQIAKEAKAGDLVVIAAPPLGSTVFATSVTAHTSATVVAVRPTSVRRTKTEWPFSGHVIVGVGDGERDSAPIRFAFDHAARHGMPVIAVHAAERDSDGAWVDDRLMETHLLGDAHALHVLDAALDSARRDYPEVPVRRAVMRAPADKALVHASSGAYMLVVGDRRRPVLVGRLLGSVSRHALIAAHCTVAVVRDST